MRFDCIVPLVYAMFHVARRDSIRVLYFYCNQTVAITSGTLWYFRTDVLTLHVLYTLIQLWLTTNSTTTAVNNNNNNNNNNRISTAHYSYGRDFRGAEIEVENRVVNEENENTNTISASMVVFEAEASGGK